MGADEGIKRSSFRLTGDDGMSPEEKITHSRFLLAYFSTPDCRVCKALLPKVRHLIDRHPHIEFLYINTHSHPRLAGQHLVFTVPTLIYFRNGKEIKRFSRFVSIRDLEAFIQRGASETAQE